MLCLQIRRRQTDQESFCYQVKRMERKLDNKISEQNKKHDNVIRSTENAKAEYDRAKYEFDMAVRDLEVASNFIKRKAS
jgi:hypothetical protein